LQQIPFKVSAKAARLIGRESVSNAEGAIGELVKNTYDADATACAILFANRFNSIPEELSKSDYEWVLQVNAKVADFYKMEEGSENEHESEKKYTLVKPQSQNETDELQDIISNFVDMWIVDNGSGMSSQVIIDNWMVIGTDYKEKNIISDAGRTRTGAKGIGRFALDRLGAKCELFSFEQANDAVRWEVDWDNFDGSGKTLDEVTARLDQVENELSIALSKIPVFLRTEIEASHFKKKQTGTFIRISHLRDNWQQLHLKKLERALSALIPPLEQKPLNIFLYSKANPGKYFPIESPLLDDYDYRVDAKFSGEKMKFEIHRKELVPHEINLKVFELEDMKEKRYQKPSFEKGVVSYDKSLKDLFGALDEPMLESFKSVGEFSFSLLFFKRTMPGKRDRAIYPYRAFRGGRKAWLDEYAGIKIYRDNFAVRPYGEVDSRAFDWLSLGQRVAANPVQSSRKGWRVGPQNLAGTITISRITNPSLYDQLTREGMIENTIFDRFKSLLLRVIQEFEDDRSHIHYNLNEIFKVENAPERKISKGVETAQRVVKSPEKATKEDAQALAEAFVAQSEAMQELREEQAMMRSLATLGTVLVSFSHEMGQLQSAMGSRSEELMGILDSYIGPNEYDPDRSPFHPYVILEDWADDDKKVKQWFSFALASVRANKRRRDWVKLVKHLEEAKLTWRGFLEPRMISVEMNCEDGFDPEILAFPIDLESIFNNLLLNSVEAFTSSKHTGKRRIYIDMFEQDAKTVKIVYRDNGPGVDQSIKPIHKIFDYNVTTKKDEKNNLVGTGLGMWILDTVVREYGGNAKAFSPSEDYGFKMEIYLPMRELSDD